MSMMPATPDLGAKAAKVAVWSELPDRSPAYALVANVDLVLVRYGDQVSAFHGRCLHRGALLADGSIEGDNLICGVHGWDYRFDSGISEYNNNEALKKFRAWVDADNKHIQELARNGLSRVGEHGQVSAMGVALTELPRWDDIQILTGQFARKPLLDDSAVGTELVIGPDAEKPLRLEIPLFVSDMSFGALSEEAKMALATGAELAGTGICSGEGGMLAAEQAANSRYFYELASAKFGWGLDKAARCQAFHSKGGQGAKTGTGGHLPGKKVVGKIAEVRGLPEGTAAISPSTFADLNTPDDFRRVADQVREASGGIPIGFKLSAQHIEADIDFALEASADYIILDGRGGGTGAAPNLFKNNISVPTIAALALARRHLDARESRATLIVTGGLRTESDFVKALALGADGIALANSALQAIGCLGMRACHTNNCPVGIATQREDLRARLIVEESAKRLERYLTSTIALMRILARACGYDHFRRFTADDLCSWKRETAELAGIRFAGVG